LSYRRLKIILCDPTNNFIYIRTVAAKLTQGSDATAPRWINVLM
jgi:hypothetical protein